MADIPEYKNRTKIEPAPVTDASSALSPLSKSWDMIGQMGAQVAQNQSNEISRINGEELGRTKPGLTLFPAIGESSAAFLKAYKTQEYATALTKGMNALDGLIFTSMAFPGEKALDNYDKYYQKYLDDVTKELTPENRTAVREQLQGAFLSGRYKISGAILNQNTGAEKDQFKQTFEIFGKRIMDSIAQNNDMEADATLAEAKAFIRNPENVYDLSPAARDALVKSLGDMYKDSKVRNEVLTAISNKKGEEIVKKYAKLPATVENMRKAEVAANTLQTYAAQTAAHDHLLTSQAATKMYQNGGLSDAELAYLKQDVTPNNFAQFETQHARFMEGQKSKTDAADFMDAYAGNSAMLKTLGGEGLNKGFKVMVDRETAKLGRQLSPQEEGAIAARFDTSIPAFNAKHGAGINSKNPEISAAYSQVYANMLRTNPNTVEGMDNKSAVKATNIAKNIALGQNPIDAANEAAQKMADLTPEDLKKRGELFDDELKGKKITGPLSQKKAVSKLMGFGNTPVPDRMTDDFIRQWKNNYAIMPTPDMDEAATLAAQTLARNYKLTDVNGFKEVMYLAPDNPILARNLLLIKSHNEFEAQKKLFDEGKVDMYYEFKTNYIKDILAKDVKQLGTESILKDVPREGSDRHYGMLTDMVTRVTRGDDGKPDEKIYGEILIRSDQYTQYPEDGRTPTYAVVFRPKDTNQGKPVYNPIDFSNYRFSIQPEDLKHMQSEQENEAYRLAEIIKQKRKTWLSHMSSTFEGQYE